MEQQNSLDEAPQIKQSLVEIAIAGTSEPSAAETAMAAQLEEIRKDLEVSQQLVFELSKPPIEMVYVSKKFLQSLKEQCESTLAVLSELLADQVSG